MLHDRVCRPVVRMGFALQVLCGARDEDARCSVALASDAAEGSRVAATTLALGYGQQALQ